MEGLCEIPGKLILKELQTQQLDTPTYSDIMNISRNMHKAISSHLFPLPTDFVESHETFSSVRVLIITKEHVCLLLIAKIILKNFLT